MTSVCSPAPAFDGGQRKNPEKNGKNRTFLSTAREQIG
jgi:hypothetical protein